MHQQIQPPFSFLIFSFHLSPLPSLPLFNSPHPVIQNHGVAKRIMGNEMAYLLLPRGETERGGRLKERKSETIQRGWVS